MTSHPVKISIMGISLVFLFAGASLAGDRFDHRQKNQKAKIHQGVRKGDITKRELVHLASRQREIERYRNHALRDGNFSRGESRRIDHMQATANRSIYRHRHNGYNQRRPHPCNHPCYVGPAHGHGHRYNRPHGGAAFYSAWAFPGWTFGFSAHGR